MSTSEVPLGDKGINPASILRAMNPELIQRDDVHRHLEAAAQGVLADLVGQHPPKAPSEDQALRARRIGKRLAAADEQSPVPAGTAERFHRATGWRLRQERGGRKKADENEANGGLHED